jgi:hypothetical protein
MEHGRVNGEEAYSVKEKDEVTLKSRGVVE